MRRSIPRDPPELFGPMHVAVLDSPMGKVYVESDGTLITRVSFRSLGRGRGGRTPGILKEAVAQLTGYFAGRRRKFDLPLYRVGTPYRKKVWAHASMIPYGHTRSYSDLARDVGGAANSVAASCAVNPLLILIPCHRVMGSDGSLMGYAGGLWRKKMLLELEGALTKEA